MSADWTPQHSPRSVTLNQSITHIKSSSPYLAFQRIDCPDMLLQTQLHCA